MSQLPENGTKLLNDSVKLTFMMVLEAVAEAGGSLAHTNRSAECKSVSED